MDEDKSSGRSELQDSATSWHDAIKDAQKAFEKYHERCDKIYELYSKGKEAPESAERQYAMLWSNIEVLKPAVYARPPVPVVAPRFKDFKPLPRKASEMLERVVTTNFELEDLDCTLQSVRDDYLIYGRGVAWPRYVTEDEPSVSSEAETVEFTENVAYDHISRRDFLHDPARKWQEVGWVARRAFLSKKEAQQRFKKNVAMIEAKQHKDATGESRGEPKIAVWEIWDKTSRKVYWVSLDAPDILDIQDPYLELQGFFPCPRPTYGTMEKGSLVPVPDFVFYKDQVEEINELTARISALSDALRLKGYYAAGEGDLAAAIESVMQDQSNRATLVPISNMAALGGASLKDSIVWLPMTEVATIIRELIALRKELVDDVYQITGISDIMRGATDPNETRGAQQIKAQWGSIRIRERQNELERFARDMTRIAGEIMAENYQPETLQQMSQMNLPTDQAIQAQVQQIIAQAQQAAQQAAQQMQQIPPEQQQKFQQQIQQRAKQIEAQIKEKEEEVTIDQVIKLYREQRARSFLIEVETDSTIQPDEDAEKQRRTEFLTAIGGFINQVGPVVQQMPETAPLVAELLKFTAGGFRAGRELEGTIEEFSDNLKNFAKKKPEGPTPEQMEAQAKAKADQERLKNETATAQANNEKTKVETQLLLRGEPQQPDTEGPKLDMEHMKLQQAERFKQADADLAVRLKSMDINSNRATEDDPELDDQGVAKPTTSEMLMPVLAGLAEALNGFVAAQSVPKQIIFDENGKPSGIAPVNLN